MESAKNLQETQYEGHLIVAPNEKLPWNKIVFLGLQHVLAMDVYVVPFVIASILSLGVAEASILIQATFLAAGIATIIQAHFCMRLPIAQGPSYVPIGAIVGITMAAGGGFLGLNEVFGSTMVASLLLVVLGLTGMFRKLINVLVPRLVGGTIILIIGLSLLPVALDSNIYAIYGTETVTQNILLALVSVVTLIFCVTLGIHIGKKGNWLRTGAVIFALAAGSVAAQLMGRFQWESVAAAGWLARPHLAFIDYMPSFTPSAILTMIFVFFVLMAETTGTWFAIGSVINEDVTPKQVDRGVVGEGLGCLVSSLVGSTPVTGYSTNAGLISITGVASRYAFYGAGAWLMMFGLSGKLATLIASIPASVIGGVFVVVCAIISLSGIRILKQERLTERNMFVIGVPMVISLALYLLPKEYMATLPELLQYVLGSTVASAAIVAIILNLILPQED
ncbi:solute carrier family 23 protein [Negativicoccus succinicivorans]|uniref:uracil-xanthine permease family protein n=1 Tax=Negativicoccus succinicivorans TaxID=620903 RepID=UPI0028FE7323|nr:solute carrier family 23 protein [Negativicoccus succinicivorans]MDU2418211.1 solute carrier family 23 protein [Negativicoccus succinicivorans]